jgi:ABC-type uncharacterized transport system permease subunit
MIYLMAFPRLRKRKMGLSYLAFGIFSLATLAMSASLASAYLCLTGPDCAHAPVSGIMLTTAISWFTILAYFVFDMRILGAFVAPVATLILFIQFFTIKAPLPSHTSVAPDAFIMFHIAAAVIGEAFAICACAVAVLYLLQQRVIKTKQLNLLTALAPSLDKLDLAMFVCLWAGFAFLTVGLVTGAASAMLFKGGSRGGLEWKILWAMAVWGWYLAILLAKNIYAFHGRRIARMSLVGFVILAVSFFGLYPWGTNLP